MDAPSGGLCPPPPRHLPAQRGGLPGCEALGVAHSRPDIFLDVVQSLLQMVVVVMHPLVQQFFDGESPHFRVLAPTREMLRAQGAHHADALIADS